MLNLLDELNPEQRLAVETTEGPVLVLAGAGTGKTRAITFRLAHLISTGVPPAQPWLSTFHSLCARLLRREAPSAGLPRDFAIYDDDDQLAAVKLALSKLAIDDEALPPRNILSRIS